MANLPLARLQMFDTPFAHTGIDYFGPFCIKQCRSEIKRYGCIFTRMTTHAVHLEVASDLTVYLFLNAFRRFITRRVPIESYTPIMEPIFWDRKRCYDSLLKHGTRSISIQIFVKREFSRSLILLELAT